MCGSNCAGHHVLVVMQLCFVPCPGHVGKHCARGLPAAEAGTGCARQPGLQPCPLDACALGDGRALSMLAILSCNTHSNVAWLLRTAVPHLLVSVRQLEALDRHHATCGPLHALPHEAIAAAAQISDVLIVLHTHTRGRCTARWSSGGPIMPMGGAAGLPPLPTGLLAVLHTCQSRQPCTPCPTHLHVR